MPSTYTIWTNTSVPPILHAHEKVLTEYPEQIEQTLNYLVTQGVIAPVSVPTKWVSSLTYLCKPDGSLHICLNPKDLNKAIVQEHYKAPTLDEIFHWLIGATCFSKLDTKDASRAYTLMRNPPTLPPFTPTMTPFLCMPFGLKISLDVF